MTKNKEQKKQGVWVRSKGFVIGMMKKIGKWVLKYGVIISVFTSLFFILLLLLLLLLQCHSCILKNNKILYWFLIAVVGLSAFFLFLWFFRTYDTKEKLGNWILKNRKKNLVFAGFCSILLLLLLLLLQCSFCIIEGNKILDYFLTAVVGLPVFFLLWFFRTHDTRESIEKAEKNIKKAEENIKQTKLFNYLENLASSEGMKVDLGVTQLIKLSKQEKKEKEKVSLNEEIKLAFIKRLSYPPPIDEKKKNEPHLFYAQYIIEWLDKNYEKLDFIELNLDNQIFNRIGKGSLKSFLNKFQPSDEKDSLQTEISFRYADLRNSEWKIDLKGVILQKANFEGANLFRANLKKANLFRASLEFTNLKEASLEFTNLEKANLEGANLKEANLEFTNLRKVNLQGANLEEVNLEFTNLRKANLKGASLEGANLKDANLEEADLKGANLKGADLEFTNLEGATLQGADLREADLKGADLREANLKGAILEDADLKGANLEGAIYNDKTKFPPDFDPKQAGMKTKNTVSPLNLK